MSTDTLSSAVNLSEGRRSEAIDELAQSCQEHLLDIHHDADHHRSVLTLAGPLHPLLSSIKRLVQVALRVLDLSGHQGQHPRFGVVDVVPFTPVGHQDLTSAIEARDRLAIWAGSTLSIPCFLYGPMPDGGTRTLPAVRKGAFRTLQPDTGPDRAHASTGAMAVGARGALVAYNLWIEGISLPETKAVASAVRSPQVRALGLPLTECTQVSCNLIEPEIHGPAQAYDQVARALPPHGRIVRAELVGLLPARVLAQTPPERLHALGLSARDVLEVRLADPSLRKRRS